MQVIHTHLREDGDRSNPDSDQRIAEVVSVWLCMGSVERIVALLKQMQDDLREEEKDEIRKKDSFDRSSAETVAQVDKVLSANKEKRAEKERALPLRLAEKQSKVEQAQDKFSTEERNNRAIAELTSEREAEHQEFLEKRDELQLLAGTLNKAKAIIAQLSKGDSFLQSKQHIFAQIKQHHLAFGTPSLTHP